MSATEGLITAEQLLEIASGRRVELVRGELVDMTPVGREHARIVVRLGSILDAFVREHKLGEVGAECGFVVARNPDIVRAPDLAFVPAGSAAVPAEAFIEGSPALAVEILSPNDKASDVQQKIREYLRHGTRLVWVVDPPGQTITAYHPSGDAHVYPGDEPVPGEDVLPGFSFLPRDLFTC